MVSTIREYSRIFCKIYEDFWQIFKIFGSTKNVRTNRILFVRTKIIFGRTKNLCPNKKIFIRIKKIFGRKLFLPTKSSSFLQNLRPNKNLFVQIFGNLIRSEKHSIPDSRTTNIRVRTKSIVRCPWGPPYSQYQGRHTMLFGTNKIPEYSYEQIFIRAKIL